MPIAISIKPVPTSAVPSGMNDGGDAQSQVGMDIADAVKQLSTDDLTTLMHGISPDALEVLEKIPDLAPFANFIESGGQSTDEDSDGGMPQPSSIGPSNANARSSVMAAMKANGVR